jgi:hypothetical protein
MSLRLQSRNSEQLFHQRALIMHIKLLHEKVFSVYLWLTYSDSKKSAFVLWNSFNTNTEPPTLIIGQFQAGNPPSLEWTARKWIDCRNPGFGDGAQAS